MWKRESGGTFCTFTFFPPIHVPTAKLRPEAWLLDRSSHCKALNAKVSALWLAQGGDHQVRRQLRVLCALQQSSALEFARR